MIKSAKGQARSRRILKYTAWTGFFIVLLIIFLTWKFIFSTHLPYKNQYNIKAELDEQTKMLKCSEVVDYFNKDKHTLKNIFFHMYPNAFRLRNHLPLTPEEFAVMYKHGFDSGYMNIISIKSSGKKLSYKIFGKDNTILNVRLNGDIKQGEKIKLIIDFKDKIPYAFNRYGYGNNTINIGNWYPIAAVHNKGVWSLEEYQKYGDPFYSDSADYKVEFKAPKNQVIAHTGQDYGETSKGGFKISRFKAYDVRDFALVLSPKFKIYSVSYKGIKIKSYYFLNGNGIKAGNIAKRAMGIFCSKFGKYPYKEYSVVETDFPVGGMEYPQVVMIDHSVYGKSYYDNSDFFQYAIVHETAHQWWYGVVGNNEVKEAWLDESLAEMSTQIYYESLFGEEIVNEICGQNTLVQYYSSVPYIKSLNILRNLDNFNSSEEYSALVYNRGCIILNNLRQAMGKKAFLKALKNYYIDYKFKNANSMNLINEFSASGKKDYRKYMLKWLRGTKKLKMEI